MAKKGKMLWKKFLSLPGAMMLPAIEDSKTSLDGLYVAVI